MSKQLIVSSAIQVALMKELLLNEIMNGFWIDQRPAGHGLAWQDVEVLVSTENQVGPVGGFVPRRDYDFLNPKFTKIFEAKMVEIAQTVKPNITFKSLKKELIELARIIGGRMTDKTQEPARKYRGNNRSDFDVIRSVDRQKVTTVAGAKATNDAALKTVMKTVIKNGAKVPVQEEGVTIMKTAAGATVRRVAISVFDNKD